MKVLNEHFPRVSISHILLFFFFNVVTIYKYTTFVCKFLFLLLIFLSQEFPMTVMDPTMASSWPLLDPSQTTQLSFGPSMDVTKLEEARMQLNGMDYSRATCQDEDGDT